MPLENCCLEQWHFPRTQGPGPRTHSTQFFQSHSSGSLRSLRHRLAMCPTLNPITVEGRRGYLTGWSPPSPPWAVSPDFCLLGSHLPVKRVTSWWGFGLMPEYFFLGKNIWWSFWGNTNTLLFKHFVPIGKTFMLSYLILDKVHTNYIIFIVDK